MEIYLAELRQIVQQYNIYKSGEITIFLSLVFLVLVSFISVVIYASKEVLIRFKIEAVTDIAIKSSFSEYNKLLYDKYGLLYVDSSYLGVETGGAECLANHVEDYIDENTLGDSNRHLGINLYSVDISETVFANHDNFASVKKQIRSYMTINKGYSDTLNDDEILDRYIDLKMPSDFYDRFVLVNEDHASDSAEDEIYDVDEIHYEPSYDEKFSEVIKEIEKDIREEANSSFNFSQQIEGAIISIYFSNENGSRYECIRYYSLSI